MTTEGKHDRQATKPLLGHLRAYEARAYVLDNKVPKGRKSMARAHIGYLVGYESTNIFRIWVPHLKCVFRSRDVRFDETKWYDPNDPHISKELREEVSDIIETIYVPERFIHFENSTPLLEFEVKDLAKEGLGKPTTEALTEATEQATPSLKETSAPVTKDLPADVPDHLPTPEPTPEPMLETMDAAPTDPLDDSTPEAENPTSPASTLIPGSFDFNDPTPRTNIAPRSNKVSADFSEVNIIEGKRQRKLSSRVLGIFNATLQSAFSANLEPKKKAIHRSNLPPAPRTWKEMQRHKFRDHWYKAAGVEIEKLQECGTYKIVPILYGKQVIPLMWVFAYKFDDKGFLLKFKARLVVRGDLVKNPSGKNTRSDTLAARTARALIAIMTYFDLDARYYDAAGVEIKKLQERGTYKIVPIPYGKQVIPLMWVFAYKFDDKGFLLKFKARLVVRGDLVKNPSCKNTRSDTLAARTARALIAIMTYFDLDARYYDGVNAFLNSFLDPDEQVYCLHPEGFSKKGTV
ncbi:hypothetical protein VTO42DRAFT_436 [Malbranchea cinnamomea]